MPTNSIPHTSENDLAVARAAALSNKLLSLLWESTQDYACAFLDTEGMIVGWVGAASDVLGYDKNEAIGQSIAILFTEEDQTLGLPTFERVVASADGRAEDDRWHVRKDGARIWVSGTMLAIREQNTVIGFAKIMRDRTDLKSQLEALRNRNATLEQSLAARDTAFAKITHEIRNNLSPMKNAAKLLSMSVEPQQAKTAHAILDRQLALLESMAHDLSEAARVGVGKFHFKKEPLDLTKELVEIVNVTRSRMAEKGQEILVFVPEGPAIVNADRQRIHQVFFNLLDNAIKYTGDSGNIWVKCILETETVVVKVEDDGTGISAAMLPLIFDLFTQESTDDPIGGMGIGLALVKTLVEAHEGQMEVRSEGKGKGSEFTVRLPLVRNVI